MVRAALAGDGRVLFVDDLPEAAGRETYLAGSGEVVERRLQDGTRHRLVKVARDQPALTRQLAEHGWHAAVTRSGPDWLLGEARPLLRALPRAASGVPGRPAPRRPVPALGRRADVCPQMVMTTFPLACPCSR